ncbi:MAG: F0F1 ATP synthase subunit B [Candidatus Omnitrophica bacterium]|nr:F0F1 ATP synthase subunit B [Candidatus Omnitrophota bacterium]
MSENSEITAVEGAGHQKPGLTIIPSDVAMISLTWITFFCLLVILQKFAWKPILMALQNREKTISDSLKQADQIQKELSDVQASKEKILSESRQNAQQIIDEARKKATELQHAIEEKAKKQAQDIIQTAHEEIAGERQRAEVVLKKQSAALAVDLASKLIKANLDKTKSDNIIAQAIKEI